MANISVHLPWPPSVNRIWRQAKGKVYRSSEYQTWIKESSVVIIEQKLPRIIGRFHAEILLHPPTNHKIDIDNRVKAILDIVELNKIIRNDNLCRRLLVEYDEADTIPVGARLTLIPA